MSETTLRFRQEGKRYILWVKCNSNLSVFILRQKKIDFGPFSWLFLESFESRTQNSGKRIGRCIEQKERFRLPALQEMNSGIQFTSPHPKHSWKTKVPFLSCYPKSSPNSLKTNSLKDKLSPSKGPKVAIITLVTRSLPSHTASYDKFTL